MLRATATAGSGSGYVPGSGSVHDSCSGCVPGSGRGSGPGPSSVPVSSTGSGPGTVTGSGPGSSPCPGSVSGSCSGSRRPLQAVRLPRVRPDLRRAGLPRQSHVHAPGGDDVSPVPQGVLPALHSAHPHAYHPQPVELATFKGRAQQLRRCPVGTADCLESVACGAAGFVVRSAKEMLGRRQSRPRRRIIGALFK